MVSQRIMKAIVESNMVTKDYISPRDVNTDDYNFYVGNIPVDANDEQSVLSAIMSNISSVSDIEGYSPEEWEGTGSTEQEIMEAYAYGAVEDFYSDFMDEWVQAPGGDDAPFDYKVPAFRNLEFKVRSIPYDDMAKSMTKESSQDYKSFLYSFEQSVEQSLDDAYFSIGDALVEAQMRNPNVRVDSRAEVDELIERLDEAQGIVIGIKEYCAKFFKDEIERS